MVTTAVQLECNVKQYLSSACCSFTIQDFAIIIALAVKLHIITVMK